MKEIAGTKVFGKYVCFWGSIFSNFAPCNIEAQGHSFKTSEQYFMWQKAMYFGDVVIADAILNAEEPRLAKELGRRVSGYDDEAWSKVRFDAMYKAVFAKFSQNKKFKEIIIDKMFDDKNFVEGSPVDNVWGVGIRWDDPMIMDESNWMGQNLLGKVLDKVRENLL